jgi:hypothetical protein
VSGGNGWAGSAAWLVVGGCGPGGDAGGSGQGMSGGVRMTDGAAKADELVKRYILRQYRKATRDAGQDDDHLANCPDVTVEEAEARFALFYDTGVDGVMFTATLRCPHGASFDYEYGELGDLPDILRDMEDDGDA